MDVISLYRRAVESTALIIDRVPEAALDARSPCSDWTIRQIVDHLVANNRTMLGRVDLTPPEPEEFATAGRVVADAFDDPSVLETTYQVGDFEVNGTGVVAIHFADVLVHGWDIGRASGQPVELEEDLLAAALRITSTFPESVRGPGKAFDRPRPVADTEPLQNRVIAFLGRDPEWARPHRQAS